MEAQVHSLSGAWWLVSVIPGQEEFEANVNCIVISSTARSVERDPTTHLAASWLRVQNLPLLLSSWVIFVKLGSFSVLKTPRERETNCLLGLWTAVEICNKAWCGCLNESLQEKLNHLSA